jgi:hypothetical protein
MVAIKHKARRREGEGGRNSAGDKWTRRKVGGQPDIEQIGNIDWASSKEDGVEGLRETALQIGQPYWIRPGEEAGLRRHN